MSIVTTRKGMLKFKKQNLKQLVKSKRYLEAIGKDTDQIDILIEMTQEDIRRFRGLI